jgi:cyclase
MLRHRVIPALLLRNESLVKTVKFGNFVYIGDPCNTVRIFNELEVDELLFLDITATREERRPNLCALRDIADECFMPLAYGGGIRSLDDAKAVFDIGIEKVAINTAAFDNPRLLTEIAECYGSQAVIAAFDVRRTWRGEARIYHHASKTIDTECPVTWAKEAELRGAGEILLTSVDREGTWTGFDVDLVKSVTSTVQIPVIAHGGCGNLKDISTVINEGKASAVATGSMVVFQKKNMGVLVNFPDKCALLEALSPFCLRTNMAELESSQTAKQITSQLKHNDRNN